MPTNINKMLKQILMMSNASHLNSFSGGVDLVLFAEEKEYLREFNQARGFRFDIHPYNTLNNVEQHPIAIGTGEETFIKLKLVCIPRPVTCRDTHKDKYAVLYCVKNVGIMLLPSQ